MAEDGEFLCDEHKPARESAQWWVDASELKCKCDHCEKVAAVYVLQQNKLTPNG